MLNELETRTCFHRYLVGSYRVMSRELTSFDPHKKTCPRSPTRPRPAKEGHPSRVQWIGGPYQPNKSSFTLWKKDNYHSGSHSPKVGAFVPTYANPTREKCLLREPSPCLHVTSQLLKPTSTQPQLILF